MYLCQSVKLSNTQTFLHSQPLETQCVYQGPASLFKWCPQSEGVFATVGRGREVKVHHIGHQKVCKHCRHTNHMHTHAHTHTHTHKHTHTHTHTHKHTHTHTHTHTRTHTQIPISCDLPVVSDVSWHSRIPLLSVASDRQLHFWMAEV